MLLTTANVPSRQKRQIVQAVPYAVEEQLASDVEDCFFALGERNDQGEILISVCGIEQMESWVEFLSHLEVAVTTMVSETSLVETSGAVAVVDDDRVHVRWSNGSGLTVPSGQLAMTLATDKEELPFEITGNHVAVESLAIQLSELEAGDREVSRNLVEETGFYLLCCQFNGRETNLLQGPYKVEEKRSGLAMVWRSVAILAGVAVLLHLLLLAGQGWFLSHKASGIGRRACRFIRVFSPMIETCATCAGVGTPISVVRRHPGVARLLRCLAGRPRVSPALA